MEDQIKSECLREGFHVEERALHRLSFFISELVEWNKRMNLTAMKSEAQILTKLVVPSLHFSEMFPAKTGKKVIDFGTGAGFPGLPLKIVFPELDVTLLDSIGKKVKFVRSVCEELKLHGLRCINERGEVLVKKGEERGSYDFGVAMAVADLSTLVQYVFPFLKRGGRLITLKGEKLFAELNNLKDGKGVQKWKVNAIKEYAPDRATPYKLISIEKCST
ncbi:MAG: 16S rRNA (guanine(527)-N(7))-methyltransferase RsmG [Nitrospinota bacterium]